MESYYIKDKSGKRQKVEFGKTRVILINTKYDPSKHDPVWNSSHARVGIVMLRSKDDLHPLMVKWADAASNIYTSNDLQIYTDQEKIPNPNFTFKRAQENISELDSFVKDMEGRYEDFKKQYEKDSAAHDCDEIIFEEAEIFDFDTSFKAIVSERR